jgi:DNA polymerase elongation subunit (family B)
MSKRKPSIVFFDIETSYNTAAVWSCGYNITVAPEHVLDERKIICICWQYMDSAEVHYLTWDEETQCDREMLSEFINVLNDCDLAIGHNGDRFDLKWIKTRAAYHKLQPVTNVVTVDTLKLIKSNFHLNSNKLDYAVQYFQCGGKMATGGLKLWKRVMAGDAVALDKMVRYCKRDVKILKAFFKRILPYVDRLPINLAILRGGTRDDCPKCASTHVHKSGFRVKTVGKYQRYHCQGCGHKWTDSRMLKE